MKEAESIRIFFDENVGDYEAKHYGAQVHSFMTVRQTRILELVDSLGLSGGAEALDAGCGPGYLLEALARRGFQVYGLDAAEGMVRCIRARLTVANPEYLFTLEVGNIENLRLGTKHSIWCAQPALSTICVRTGPCWENFFAFSGRAAR